MPTLAGFTGILTTPCLSATPLVRMPAPFARTRTPGTRLPRRVTTALMVLRLPTVSVVFVETVSVGHTTTAGARRTDLTCVGSSVPRLLAVFVSAWAPTITVTFRIVPGCGRPDRDRDGTGRPARCRSRKSRAAPSGSTSPASSSTRGR